MWYCEQPTAYHDSDSRSRLNHRCLPPVVITPSADPSAEGTFEDWTILSHPASRLINIHIYGLRGPAGSKSSLVTVGFNASSYSDSSLELLYRTHLHLLQQLNDQGTTCDTQLSIRSSMIYFSAYSTTIGWTMIMLGTSNLGGASFLRFVKDGVISYTNRHSTWVCISNVPMATLLWTH
jgi:hypothetical protein